MVHSWELRHRLALVVLHVGKTHRFGRNEARLTPGRAAHAGAPPPRSVQRPGDDDLPWSGPSGRYFGISVAVRSVPEGWWTPYFSPCELREGPGATSLDGESFGYLLLSTVTKYLYSINMY